ncbi:MAG: chemotaxis protein CheX [Gemmatimonadaceae bacterium]
MEQSLSQTMAATFEELAFICADTKLSDVQSEAPVDVAMTVSFDGPLSGRLVLRATAEILPGIAENMLGANGNFSPSIQRDALGELANVMCGNLLPLIGGAKSVFKLSAPHEYVTGAESPNCLPAARASIGIENGRAVAQLLLSDSSRHILEFNTAAA